MTGISRVHIWSWRTRLSTPPLPASSSKIIGRSGWKRATWQVSNYRAQSVRISTLTALIFLALAVAMASGLPGAIPRSSRVQSSIEPALIKLHDLYVSSGAQPSTTPRPLAPSPYAIGNGVSLESARIADGFVLIEAVADDGEKSLAELETLGIVDGTLLGHSVSGLVPITAIPMLESVDGLKSVRMARSEASTGSVMSQDDAGTHSEFARIIPGVDGSGVTIGIVSNSYDCLGGAAADVASGDLPSGVVVQQEMTPCGKGTDEGRAMAQIVHDVAPGAKIIFQTGFGGAVSMADGILKLESAGANIIVDDIKYFTEPFFQDGVIAQAVDTVTAAGVVYFSAAGNDAANSYESAFRPGSSYALEAFPSAVGAPTFLGGTAHDFDPGDGVTNFQRIRLPALATTKITLQWDQPAFSVSGGSGSANEVDIYMFDEAETMVLAGAATVSRGADPIEFFTATNLSDAPLTVKLGIFHDGSVGGPAPGLIKYIHFDEISVVDFATSSSTIFGHANASGTGSVAAAGYLVSPGSETSLPVTENFTSLGGTTILFDVDGNSVSLDRQKPDFTGVGGADTTFFGSDSDFNDLPNFFGTSAAAPHAAAVAALMLEENPALTPADVHAILQSTATDIGTTGFDNFTGYGLIDPVAAISLADSILANDVSPLPIEVSESGDIDGAIQPNSAFFPQGPDLSIESPQSRAGVSGVSPLRDAADDGTDEGTAQDFLSVAEIINPANAFEIGSYSVAPEVHLSTVAMPDASEAIQEVTIQPIGTPVESSPTLIPVTTRRSVPTSTALLESGDIPTSVAWWWIVVGGALALAILPGVRMASSSDRFRSTVEG